MTIAARILLFCRKYWVFTGLVALIIVARAALLLISPPGFYLDESAGGAHVIAMLQHHTNAHGQSWPLFSASLGGGYTTPIYLYPLTAWAAVFGTSEYALRAFSLAATIATAFLLGWTLRLWLNNRTALTGIVIALILPWGWVQGSVAWDPALVPFFVAAALAGFSVAYKTVSRHWRMTALILTGLSLILLAYLYPPCRVTAPLLLVMLYGLLVWHKKLSAKTVTLLALLFATLCLPLLHFMLQPEALERSRALSVFYHTSVFSGLWQTLVNMLALLNPLFLFVTGDANLRHATGQQGMLGLAALPPLVTLLYVGVRHVATHRPIPYRAPSQKLTIVYIAVIGILFSLLGSALTSEGQPHSLRATAAWPFFTLLIAIGWTELHARFSRTVQVIAVVVAVTATLWYVVDLAVYYPTRSAASFDVPSRHAINNGQPTPDYPTLSLDYYRNR